MLESREFISDVLDLVVAGRIALLQAGYALHAVLVATDWLEVSQNRVDVVYFPLALHWIDNAAQFGL